MAGGPYFHGAYFGPAFDVPAVLGGGDFLPDGAGCDSYFDRTYFDPTYFCTDDAPPSSDGGHHATRRLLVLEDEAEELFALI